VKSATPMARPVDWKGEGTASSVQEKGHRVLRLPYYATYASAQRPVPDPQATRGSFNARARQPP